MKKLLFLLFFTLNCYAGTLTEKVNCQLYISKKSAESYDYMMDDLTRLLKDKGYKLQTISVEKKVKIGSDYILIKTKRSFSPLSPCITTLTIKTTKGEFISELDETKWINRSTRRYPRTSITGGVRCLYAMKDALAALKKCD